MSKIFLDEEEAWLFAESCSGRTVLFFQVYGLLPEYTVVEWPIQTSINSIWPKSNDANWEWQLLGAVEMAQSQGPFPDPTPRSANLCFNYVEGCEIIRQFFGREDGEILQIANMILEPARP